MNISRPSKACFLEAFEYSKTTKRHPLGAGMFVEVCFWGGFSQVSREFPKVLVCHSFR